MIKVKTSNLEGLQLDYALASVLGLSPSYNKTKSIIEVYEEEPWPGADSGFIDYEANWNECGFLINNHDIRLSFYEHGDDREKYSATIDGSVISRGKNYKEAVSRLIVSMISGGTIYVEECVQTKSE